MATKAARPCRRVGCSALVRDGTGYCDQHREDKNIGRFADRQRGSRHERGYGSSWTRARDYVMRRDSGLCQPCLRFGRVTQAVAVDHIVPKAEGGTDADGNLQAICKACHDVKTAEEGNRARAGRGA